MNRYLTIYIPKTAVPAPVSRFLRTQAGLTKKQISQAKFRPGGIRKNGQPQTQFHILIPQLQNLQVLMSILTIIIHWLQRHSFFLSWRSYTKTRISSP